MTLMKAKKPLALLLALLAALSLLGTTALAAGLPEETIAHKRSCAARTADTRTKKYFHRRNTQKNPCRNRKK